MSSDEPHQRLMATGTRALPAGGALRILQIGTSREASKPVALQGLSDPRPKLFYWPQKQELHPSMVMPAGIKHALADTYEDVLRNHTDGCGALVLLRSLALSISYLFIGHYGVLARSQSFRRVYWTGFAILVGAELNCELAKISTEGKIEEKHEPSPITRIDFSA